MKIIHLLKISFGMAVPRYTYLAEFIEAVDPNYNHSSIKWTLFSFTRFFGKYMYLLDKLSSKQAQLILAFGPVQQTVQNIDLKQEKKGKKKKLSYKNLRLILAKKTHFQIRRIPKRAQLREICKWEKFWYCRNKTKLQATVYNFGRKIPDLARQYFKASASTVEKEFEMA